MKSTLSCRMRIVSCCCLLVATTLLLGSEARGQDTHPPIVSAPPPMKFISRDERAQLSAARDLKARTRATIELAEARLSRAEQLTAAQRYDAASAELGAYQGLIEDVIAYLNENKKNSHKQRDTYKRLELALRAQCSRLEAIRRVTPSEYALHVKTICECARNARTEALNGFYGDTVVRQETSHDSSKSSGSESLKDKDAASGPIKRNEE
jgi:hypothetical protein